MTDDIAAWLGPVLTKDAAGVAESHEEDCESYYAHECDCLFREMRALIATHRQILELHARVVRFQWAGQVAYGCDACKDTSPAQDDDTWPCETVRVMASTYADRPGYNEEWLPERLR